MKSLLFGALLTAACGNIPDSRPAIDAAPEPDGPPADASTHGMVKGKVLDILGNGAPRANIPVVFINPDGTVVSTAMSDSNGNVSAMIDAGASATVVWLTGTNYTVATIEDLHPGDDLTLGFTLRDNTDEPSIMYGVMFPAYAGASSYSVYGPCGYTPGNAGAMVLVPFTKTCKPEKFDVAVVAYNASNNPIAYNEKLGVDRTTESSTTLSTNWKLGEYFNASYYEIPDIVTDIYSVRRSLSPFTSLSTSASSTGDPGAGTAMQSSDVAMGGGKYAYVQTQLGSATSQQVLSQRTDAKAYNYGMDVKANILPWIMSKQYDGPTKTFSMTLSADGGTIDMAFYYLRYQKMLMGTTYNYEYILFQRTADPASYPPLPEPFATQIIPTEVEAMAASTVGAFLVESSDYANYDDTRENVFDTFDQSLNGLSLAETARATVAF